MIVAQESGSDVVVTVTGPVQMGQPAQEGQRWDGASDTALSVVMEDAGTAGVEEPRAAASRMVVVGKALWL
jgi:hypothetical protein